MDGSGLKQYNLPVPALHIHKEPSTSDKQKDAKDVESSAFAASQFVDHLYALDTTPSSHAWHMLLVLVLCTAGGMTPWFSTAAIVSDLSILWDVSISSISLLTIAANLGLLTGVLLSVLCQLSEIASLPRHIAIGTALAALFNAGLLIPGVTFGLAVVMRVFTGVALALVYPMACKLVTTWFVAGRGVGMGAVLGAVGVGCGIPHLVRSILLDDWRRCITVCSLIGGVSSIISLLLLSEGPLGTRAESSKSCQASKSCTTKTNEKNDEYSSCQNKLANITDECPGMSIKTSLDSMKHEGAGANMTIKDAEAIKLEEVHAEEGLETGRRIQNDREICGFEALKVASSWKGVMGSIFSDINGVLRNPECLCCIIAYCGHNYELFGIWAWYRQYCDDSRVGRYVTKDVDTMEQGSALAAFLVMACSALSPMVTSLFADYFGRTRVCLISVVISLGGGLAIGDTMNCPHSVLWAGWAWCMVTLADAAQYGAMMAEVAPPDLAATALTMQFGIGYLFSLPGMIIIPAVVPTVGWAWGWRFLCVGPLVALLALLKLCTLPGAKRIQ